MCLATVINRNAILHSRKEFLNWLPLPRWYFFLMLVMVLCHTAVGPHPPPLTSHFHESVMFSWSSQNKLEHPS